MECHQAGEGWLLSSVLQISLLLSVLLRAVWIQSRESPVATSSANREDVSRFLLFPSTVAAEGAGMSIPVPVVMQAKDDAWSPALLIPRTLGPKEAQGRCEGPSSYRLGSDRTLRGNPCQGSMVSFQRPLSFWRKLGLVNDTMYLRRLCDQQASCPCSCERVTLGLARRKGIFISGVRKGLDTSRCLTSVVPLHSEFLGREKHTQDSKWCTRLPRTEQKPEYSRWEEGGSWEEKVGPRNK